MTPNDADEFFVELVSQLFHADVLIAEPAQRIETLEAEIPPLRRMHLDVPGSAA